MQPISRFISICLALILRTQVESDKFFFGDDGKPDGFTPNILVIIWNRAMMSEEEFSDFLENAYCSWKKKHHGSRGSEDQEFVSFFTRKVIQEIIKLQEVFVNPTLDLEVKISMIISFLVHYLKCDTPNRKFLLLLNCLCSKALYFDRKLVSNQKYPKRLYELLIVNETNVQIQSFFLKYMVDLLNAHPALHHEIQNLSGNNEVMFDSAKTGFKLLTDLFLKQEIPEEITSLAVQRRICGSMCFLFFLCLQEPRLAKQVLQKFRSAHPRFLRFLIERSHITLVLVWRMFHMDRINKLRRIPNSFVAKLMMTIGIFPEFIPSNHFTRCFLSLPMHPK